MTNLIRYIILNLILLFVFNSTASVVNAQSDYPKIQAYIEPDGNVIIGQTVKLYIEIERLDGQTGSPIYPEIIIDGAVILQPEQLGTSYSKKEDGQSIVGVRQKFAVIPKRSGNITIPSLNITWRGSENLTLVTGEIPVTVTIPAGVQDIARLIVGADVRIRQSVRPNKKTFQKGDAIERTVIISASDTIGLTLPPMLLFEIPGLSHYPKSPQIVDKSNRGNYNTTRSDTTIYVVEEDGEYSLPELPYSWFDVKTNILKKITVPAITFNVISTKSTDVHAAKIGKSLLPSFETATGIFKSSVAYLRKNITVISMLAFIFAAVFLLRRKIQESSSTRIHSLLEYFEAAERVSFMRVVSACILDNSADVRRLFWLWIEEIQKIEQITIMPSLEEVFQADDVTLVKNILIGPFSADPPHINFGLFDLIRLRGNVKRVRKKQTRNDKKHTLNPKSNELKSKC
jgi:hypothetical protein